MSDAAVSLAEFIRDWIADEANQPGWGTYVGDYESLDQTIVDGELNFIALSDAILDRLKRPSP